MKIVYIADIDTKSSPHVRDCINEAVVADYAEDMKAKDKFPLVILFTTDNKNYLVGDGLHRISAHQLLKRKAIEADVRRGGYEEALLFALAANNKHGQRRSADDKRAGVKVALKQWPTRSDTYLAEVCFVSDYLVKTVRDSLVKTQEIEEAPVRQAKDGRKVVVEEVEPLETPPEPKPKPPKDKPEEVVTDALGWPIPKQLLPMWARNKEVNAILNQLNVFKGILTKAQESKDLLWGEVLFSNAQSDLQKVWENIATARGYAVCHVCAGRPDIQPNKCCPTCKSKGLLSRFRWNTVVPAEIKKIRQQTKQKDK